MRKMTGLLYKDWKLLRTTIIVLLTASAVMGCMPLLVFLGGDTNGVTDDEFQMLGTLMMGLFFLITPMFTFTIMPEIFKIDEKKEWGQFILSSPDAAKAEIRTKYEFALVLMILNLIVNMLVLSFDMMVMDVASSISIILVLEFYLIMLLNAFEFPYFTRFGTKKANAIRVIPLLIIFIVFFVYLLFGDLSVLGDFDKVLEYIFDVMTGKREMKVIPYITAAMPIVAVVAYILSYKLSCKLYRKGVEKLEN